MARLGYSLWLSRAANHLPPGSNVCPSAERSKGLPPRVTEGPLSI